MALPSIRAVLAQALLLPIKNPKLVFAVLLVALVPRLLLLFTCYSLESLLVLDIASNIRVLRILGVELYSPEVKPMRSKIIGDARQLAIVFSSSTVVLYVAAVLETIVAVHSADMIRLKKQLNPGRLLSKIAKSWKGTLLTFLLGTILLSGYIVLLVSLHAFLVLVLYGSWVLMGFALFAVSIPALVSVIYAGFVCDIARVVVVVEEEGCFGFDALVKAVRILRGREMKGFLLAVALLSAKCLLGAAYGLVVMESARKEEEGAVAVVLTGLVPVGLESLLVVCSLAVYAVFYHDCKAGGPEAPGVELSYSKLPTEG